MPSDRPALPASPKIQALPDLLAALAPLRATRRIVFTNGCYDILHPGHCDLLARCKTHGDRLVVALNSDASVRRLKGPTRPVNALPDRAFVMAALACVDFVTWFEEDTPFEIISAIRPHVLIKGGDWSIETIVGRDVVQADGGTVLSLPLLPGYSTTGLIERVLALSPPAATRD